MHAWQVLNTEYTSSPNVTFSCMTITLFFHFILNSCKTEQLQTCCVAHLVIFSSLTIV
jgi:hypothetical protein